MKRITLVIIAVVTLLLMFIYTQPFAATEIEILDHLSEENTMGVDQICLIHHPPGSSEALQQAIQDFDHTHPIPSAAYRRTFIIQSDDYLSSWFPFAQNIQYTDTTTQRKDLYNMDILAFSTQFKDVDGRWIKKIRVLIGQDDYYHEYPIFTLSLYRRGNSV